MATNKALPVEGPATRFGAVQGFLIDRGARNYLSVFAACGEQSREEEAERIEKLWNRRVRISPDDLPLVVRMERVVAHLKAA